MKHIKLSKLLPAWATILVTVAAPFGPSIYDAVRVGDVQFVYSYEYIKNPVLEWNRQVSAALTRLDESINNAGGLQKSLLQSITQELQANAPALAAYENLMPFDAVQVKISNVSYFDLKNIKVIFHGCIGYDSHTTWPDTIASLQRPEEIRKLPEPTTISYQKLIRKKQNYYYNAYVTYYGDDTSQCEPEVYADLDNGKSAVGTEENIEEYSGKINEDRRWWENLFGYIYKLGAVSIILALYFRLNDKITKMLSPI